MTPLGHLLSDHGYWLLAVGALFEGETAVVLSGFAAHRGYLDWRYVFAIAAVCGWTNDNVLFWLGRKHGPAVLARWPRWNRHAGALHRRIEQKPWRAIFGVRFAYGLRVVGPVLIGMSRVPAKQFLLFNTLGALAWAALLTAVGWFFGEAAHRILGRLAHIEGWLLGALAIGGVGFWWAVLRRRKREDLASRV